MPNRSTTDIDRLSPVNALSSHFHFPLKNVLAGFNRWEMLDHIKRYIFMGHVGEYISVSEVYCTNNFHSPPHHTSSILSAFWLPTRTCCCLRRAIVLNLGIKRSSNCEVFWWWHVWILSGHTFRGSLASWCHSATLGMRYAEFVYLYLCICVFVYLCTYLCICVVTPDMPRHRPNCPTLPLGECWGALRSSLDPTGNAVTPLSLFTYSLLLFKLLTLTFHFQFFDQDILIKYRPWF